jgi:hypothetical protein
MNEEVYRAILARLGVTPSRPAPGAASRPLAPPSRVEIFRAQLDAWRRAGRLGFPLFVLPDVEIRPGHCMSCGAPLEAGRTWRCAPCLAAVEEVLG